MSDIKHKYYKYCIVPLCTNTTSTCSEKLFLSVPKDPSLRKTWTNAMRRDDNLNPKLSSKTPLKVCEDHFSLKDDMENYMEWQLTKHVKRLKLKPGIVPHRFECQNRNSHSPIERKGAEKRKHKSKQNENADNLKKTPGRKRRKVLAKEITSDEVDSSSLKCLNNQKDSCFNLDEKDNSECVPAVNLKVEEPWEEESKFTSKPFEDNSQDYDELQIEIKDVRSVPSSFTAEVADENTTGISEKSSHFERPLKIQKREEIFGTLVASELSGLSVNPELYLKTKRTILDILIQAHFELINCGS